MKFTKIPWPPSSSTDASVIDAYFPTFLLIKNLHYIRSSFPYMFVGTSHQPGTNLIGRIPGKSFFSIESHGASIFFLSSLFRRSFMPISHPSIETYFRWIVSHGLSSTISFFFSIFYYSSVKISIRLYATTCDRWSFLFFFLFLQKILSIHFPMHVYIHICMHPWHYVHV